MAEPRIIAGLASAMRHLGERQTIIAQNIANSETPGYQARELDKPDFGALLNVRSGGHVARPSVAVTSGMAALGAHGSAAASGVIIDTHVGETKPDGNSVTLEDQVLKMGQIQADYATLANIYRKQMALMKIAIGRGQ